MNKKFIPTNTRDHLFVDVRLQLKIGVSDCEDEDVKMDFLKDLKEKVSMTGASVILSSMEIDSKHPFDGSTREKFYMDMCYEESNFYPLEAND